MNEKVKKLTRLNYTLSRHLANIITLNTLLIYLNRKHYANSGYLTFFVVLSYT